MFKWKEMTRVKHLKQLLFDTLYDTSVKLPMCGQKKDPRVQSYVFADKKF